MSRAHREILHLARLIDRLAKDLTHADAERYLVRDAQRVIEAIESLVRLHNAQEEDIMTRSRRNNCHPQAANRGLPCLGNSFHGITRIYCIYVTGLSMVDCTQLSQMMFALLRQATVGDLQMGLFSH
jgi:hypothetical protein